MPNKPQSHQLLKKHRVLNTTAPLSFKVQPQNVRLVFPVQEDKAA
jgi:hypothetical protein